MNETRKRLISEYDNMRTCDKCWYQEAMINFSANRLLISLFPEMYLEDINSRLSEYHELNPYC